MHLSRELRRDLWHRANTGVRSSKALLAAGLLNAKAMAVFDDVPFFVVAQPATGPKFQKAASAFCREAAARKT